MRIRFAAPDEHGVAALHQQSRPVGVEQRRVVTMGIVTIVD
jgi:hypothetical protein